MEIFRPDSRVIRTRTNQIPHWSQSGAVTFVTWRTKDSIPKKVLSQWICEREKWCEENGIPTREEEEPVSRWLSKLPQQRQLEYHRRFSRSWNEELDKCHGECLLRNQALSKIVKESLLFSQGDTYQIDSFVVMPNHVHLLAAFKDADEMLPQIARWKRFTARKINEFTNRSGNFWQPDCFDHLVRSRRQWDRIDRYISDNPKKSRLKKQEYAYWSVDSEVSESGEAHTIPPTRTAQENSP